MVVDGIREADEIAPLLPGTPGSLVIAAGRSNLVEATTKWGAATLPLDVASDEDALTLLAARAGHERVDREPEAARELVDLYGRLALAIAITGAAAASRPAVSLADFVRELRSSKSVTAETQLRSVFDGAYRQLSPDAKRVYRALGVHPGPDIDISAVSAIAGLSRLEASMAATELTRSSLLQEHRFHRYSLHPLLGQHARELLSENEFNAAVLRMAVHYAENGVDADMDALTPIIIEARRAGLDKQVCGLAFVLTPLLESQDRWDEVIEIQTYAREAAARLGDHLTEARTMAQAATALQQLGRVEEASTLRRASAGVAQKIITARESSTAPPATLYSARAAERPAGPFGGQSAPADREGATHREHQPHAVLTEKDYVPNMTYEELGRGDDDKRTDAPVVTPLCCGPPPPDYPMPSGCAFRARPGLPQPPGQSRQGGCQLTIRGPLASLVQQRGLVRA